MPIALKTEGLSKVYRHATGKPTTALHPLDLEVGVGEHLAVIGPNGSGKTTLLGLTVGLLVPTSGTVHIFGRSSREASARARIGYVPEDPVLQPRMRVNELLEVCGRLSGLSAADTRDRAGDLLDRFELTPWAGSPLGELSRGMRQAVAMVQALLHRPGLLLLDEPLTGVDPDARTRLIGILGETRQAHTAMVVTTHWPEAFGTLFDRVVTLRRGRLMAEA
ncbi:MAG: ABC transporter ATP-binding protein [Deltaproteobacteria bacterium]|nr:ABC transporter ATP-binding protein [Deltaproteobacteria bacterium]MBW2255668.1 ABC transporter ATP-binding protein [Deltaproteobacteria bacterium]